LLIRRFKANRKKVIKATLLLSFFGIFGIGGVLAASNITLNAALPITLGAGYTTATACDDAVTLNTQTILDPSSGQFYVATIALSDISQNATTGCGNKTMELALKINGQMTYASWDIPAANADSTFIFSTVTSSLSDYYAMSALTPFNVDGLTNIAIAKIGSFNLTYDWIGRDTSRFWRSITSSSDGTKLAAVVQSGLIYTSTNSGVTWTERTNAGGGVTGESLSKSWRSITSSSDGTKLAAAPYNGYNIYTSNDSGVNWTQQTASGAKDWTSITSSADGSKLAAVAWMGSLSTSSDSGVNWISRSIPFNYWRSITSSSDGTKLAVVGQDSNIYTSIDSGVTWTSRASQRRWHSITSSSDGSKLAAIVDGGYIYTSSDSGATWTQRDTARNWSAITSSSDGIKLSAAVSQGYIYHSSDSGVTWTQSTTIGTAYWASIASSSDGSKLVAGGQSTQIYIGSAGSKTRSNN